MWRTRGRTVAQESASLQAFVPWRSSCNSLILRNGEMTWRSELLQRLQEVRGNCKTRNQLILIYLKTYALQVVQGRLFGMGQSKANQWIHMLLPALLAALRTLGDAPARSLTDLAQRLGVSEADVATVVTPLEEPAPVAAPASPLSPMTGRNGASSAPKTLLNRPKVIAARKRITPSKMSC